MSSPTHLKNIALVGASGNLGSLVLSHLHTTTTFNLTILTRSTSNSNSTFPSSPRITIERGDYSSPSFLASALANQDALILTLHWDAIPVTEIQLIEAAATAGVKWILPTEFGSDNADEALANMVPLAVAKAGPRKRIEELRMKWIGVVTNPWFDYSLTRGMFMIDVQKRTAHILSGGVGKFNTTNLAAVALAIVRLVSLPIVSDSGASLSDYGNRFIYIRSFLTSQTEIFEAVKRVTKTSDSDLTITEGDAQAFIDEGPAKLAKGDFMGMVNLLYGPLLKGGMGGDFESVRGVSNDVLGLPEEDLDDAVKNALELAKIEA